MKTGHRTVGGRGARRRGSIIVLVVGALALLSIITVVYLRVGQTDRRTSAVVVRESSIESDMERIAGYLAGVIADNRMATYPEAVDSQGQTLLMRSMTDFPSTDPQARSVPRQNELRFTPVGSYGAATGPGIGNRPLAVPSNPWLASTGPTWLNFTGSNPSNPAYRDHRDWYHISNFAPDGRFVNLGNLISNFDAPPGTQPGQMSYALYRLDGMGRPTQRMPWGEAADPNVPWHWDTNEVGLFRPATDLIVGGPGGPLPPGFRLSYLYADADGDGVYDSRWFMLIDASDPLSPISLLPRDGRYRWFVAARAVDLSGLLNVNTSTDQVNPPLARVPIGLTPSDMDLRRLLMQADEGVLYPEMYGRIENPQGARPDNYDYGPDGATEVRRAGALAYKGVRLAQNDKVVPPTGADLNAMWPDTRHFDAEDRAIYFLTGSRLSSSDYYRGALGGPQTLEMRGFFDRADQLSLMARRSTPYRGIESRLEQAVGGRDPNRRGFSPLRSNRSAAFELDTIDNAENSGEGNGRIDDDAMARFTLDLRQHLTAISGASPLRSGPVEDSERGRLSDADLQVNARKALLDAIGAEDNVNRIHFLFSGYADALLPWSGQVGAWRDASLRTLHFGGTAEAALRTAAHMAVNMVDSFDKDLRPTARTLLISGSPTDRLQVENNRVLYPWWEPGDYTQNLDLGDTRLAGPGDNPSSIAVNVFGIEKQPFLTQVAMWSMYTDYNDVEPPDNPGRPGETPLVPINIKGEINSGNLDSNTDFLMTLVAFQLTNPFDESLDLTGDKSTGFSDFYLEFNGNLFRIAELLDDGAEDPITILPGESIVLVAVHETSDVGDPLSRVAARFSRVDGTIGTGELRRMIKRQFGGLPSLNGASDQEVYLIPRMTRTGQAIHNNVDSLIEGAGTDPKKYEVHLWRVLQNLDERNNTRNDTPNDMLADRMRDPNVDRSGSSRTATLHRRISTDGQDKIEGTDVDDDNQGWSIVLWGSYRRHDDPDGGASSSPPIGGIPAYCIEAHAGWVGSLTNLDEIEPGQRDVDLTVQDFKSGGAFLPNADQSLGELVRKLGSPSAPPMDPTMARQAAKRSADPMPGTRDGRTFSDARPVAWFDNNEFEWQVSWSGRPPRQETISTLRLTDLLLPLGIGPSHDPRASDSHLEQGWITLAEALALATNHATPPPIAGAPNWIYSEFGAPGGPLDRGNLSLDTQAPFEDRNGQDGVFTIGSSDRRRAPGIPLALHVLEVFTTTRLDQGSLTTPTAGLVNVNTAPLAVLRALPVLSPNPVQGEWWGQQGGRNFLRPDTPLGSDIAATLLAYRDKRPVRDRLDRPITFEDTGRPGDLSAEDGRAARTGIGGLRERPGLGSRGEILALITDATNRANPNSIDHLGYNGTNDDLLGVSSRIFADDSLNTVVDGVRNDYGERLLIAAAAINSVSVRSDLYAVWFVVHGYQRTDTENLVPGDPLVPSVARRYLMIVDRSNVTGVGDKPHIVLFTEVPM